MNIVLLVKAASVLSFRVQKADHIKAKDVAWPFKVVGIQEKKTIYLSASSQDDQQVRSHLNTKYLRVLKHIVTSTVEY